MKFTEVKEFFKTHEDQSLFRDFEKICKFLDDNDVSYNIVIDERSWCVDRMEIGLCVPYVKNPDFDNGFNNPNFTWGIAINRMHSGDEEYYRFCVYGEFIKGMDWDYEEPCGFECIYPNESVYNEFINRFNKNCTCNHCKKAFAYDENWDLKKITESWNLCPDCYKEFLKFMNEEEELKNEN